MTASAGRRLLVASAVLLGAAVVVVLWAMRHRPPVVTPVARAVPDSTYRGWAATEPAVAVVPEDWLELNGRKNVDRASRRAYEGAPPTIPHELITAEADGRACLACHEFGGWAQRYEAFATITPHPQLLACRQCHVPRAKDDDSVFVRTDWRRMTLRVPGPALPLGPPVIPHDLESRQGCLSCHLGPGSAEELTTPHPQRSVCLQCHVVQAAVAPFTRGGGS